MDDDDAYLDYYEAPDDDRRYCQIEDEEGRICDQRIYEEDSSSSMCQDHYEQDRYCGNCLGDAKNGQHTAECIAEGDIAFEYAYEHDMAEPLPVTRALWAKEAEDRKRRGLAA